MQYLTENIFIGNSDPPIAWTVDFNLTLQQFQPQVAGLRNLVDFALSSPHNTPPPLLFTSSIAVLGRKAVSLHIGPTI